MPEQESFWNPYRWVTYEKSRPSYRSPNYQHAFAGARGLLDCELEVLTPLVIGNGKQGALENFTRHGVGGVGKPFIPATSLKGAIRSLAELIGDSAVPFSRKRNAPMRLDPGRSVESGARGRPGTNWELDPVARSFGYLDHDGNVFAGLIQFSDAELVGEPNTQKWPRFEVDVGTPRPERHAPFYPDNKRWKFYHHLPGATTLRPAITGQTRRPVAAPPGTRFRFTVSFWNLDEEALNLLVYCLALEEDVTVTLSAAALGRPGNSNESVPLTGPLRHKIGGCKPAWGGSVHIRIVRVRIEEDPLSRYRSGQPPTVLEDEAEIRAWIEKRTASIRRRNDRTMRELRAMLIYSPNDPRRDIRYPDKSWFDRDKQLPPDQKRKLKPTV